MSATQAKQPNQQQIVAGLAEATQLPVEQVNQLYEHEHAALANGARIKNFLHIFAARNVQDILRKRGIEKGAAWSTSRRLLGEQRTPVPPPLVHGAIAPAVAEIAQR